MTNTGGLVPSASGWWAKGTVSLALSFLHFLVFGFQPVWERHNLLERLWQQSGPTIKQQLGMGRKSGPLVSYRCYPEIWEVKWLVRSWSVLGAEPPWKPRSQILGFLPPAQKHAHWRFSNRTSCWGGGRWWFSGDHCERVGARQGVRWLWLQLPHPICNQSSSTQFCSLYCGIYGLRKEV